MAIKVVATDQWVKSETAVVGLFQGALPKTGSELDSLLQKLKALGDLTGRRDEVHVLYPEGRLPKRVVVCGLGDQDRFQLENARRCLGRAMKRAKSLKARDVAVLLDTFQSDLFPAEELAQAAALAAGLSFYRYQDYVTTDPENREIVPKVQLAAALSAGLADAARRGEVIADCANFSRGLANQPGNALYPEALAEVAQALAKTWPKLSAKVLRKAQLEKEGFGALLGVGSGSARPPVLIEIAYKGAGAAQAPIALVGKGITFDSGGICLKPAAKMEDMRFDMSGAAAVLGILRAAAILRLPVNLVGVIPAAENMPSGTALKPGDILKSLSGQSIEVLNTDAEGRLILADGLTYACRHNPARIIDLATLTGAVTVALGNLAIGLMGNHDLFIQEIQQAAQTSGERVWQLPLWEDYQELIKSEVADMSNISPKPGAGTIVGGIFLQKFAGKIPWVHLDIAGTAYGDEGPVYTKGATGAGVRLVVEWLWQQYGA